MAIQTLEIMLLIHIDYTHIYIYEELFSKAQFIKLKLALEAQFLEWHLWRFGKDLFLYSLVSIGVHGNFNILKTKTLAQT